MHRSNRIRGIYVGQFLLLRGVHWSGVLGRRRRWGEADIRRAKTRGIAGVCNYVKGDAGVFLHGLGIEESALLVEEALVQTSGVAKEISSGRLDKSKATFMPRS